MHKMKKLAMLLALKTGQRVHILGAFDIPNTDMYMNYVKKSKTHFGDPDRLSSWTSFILQLLKLIVHYVQLKPAQILGNHSTFM